jgi:hypothetical protein
MQMQVDVPQHSSPSHAPGDASRIRRSLDALTYVDSAGLERVFAEGEPFRPEALDGHPRGRVLAIPGWDHGIAANVLRRVHAASWWPWEGKSFATNPRTGEGRGINRALVPTRRALFPFRTYETSSVVDRRPCFAIDYDVPENPPRARLIYDEVRRVGGNLFLGRGMRRRPGQREPSLVLWFALDAGKQDVPVEIVKG